MRDFKQAARLIMMETADSKWHETEELLISCLGSAYLAGVSDGLVKQNSGLAVEQGTSVCESGDPEQPEPAGRPGEPDQRVWRERLGRLAEAGQVGSWDGLD